MARIAKMGLFLAVAVACMAMSPRLSAGQFLAPSPDLDCTSEIVQLLPCVDFLTNSSVTTVVPACCTALSNISSAAPACLCELISPANANASAEFNINDTRALQLPGMCSLKISPASCSAILAPAVPPASIALAPAPSPAPAAAVPGKENLPPSPGPFSPSITVASPSPSADCTAATTELVSCADFLTDSASSPSSTCCKKLGEVVTSSPSCLCELATQAGSLAMQVNATRVAELPPLCRVTVSLNDCRAAGPSAPGGITASIAQPAFASNLFMSIALCAASLAHAILLQ